LSEIRAKEAQAVDPQRKRERERERERERTEREMQRKQEMENKREEAKRIRIVAFVLPYCIHVILSKRAAAEW